ncbi:siderophore-interacting protein [Paracoccus litorisediminis]|nr:siderophore-interacting protein [Paracoccus litorisediminis]
MQAHARIAFPAAEDYFQIILDALDAHMLPTRRIGPHEAVAGTQDEIHLCIQDGRLDVDIRSDDPAQLNSMRYSVTSLIDFNAREAALAIVWQGDRAGDTLPAELQVLHVVGTETLGPNFRRIWFTGADLARYNTVAQLHCRLLFKRGRGVPEAWPMMTDAGRIRWPEGRALLDTRLFTIRHVDLAGARLAVDFHLGSHAGPATDWARGAQPGDGVGFIGPAAQGLVEAEFHVFAGDETGLPGIARCLAALGHETKGVALIEIDGPQDEQIICAPRGCDIRWLHRQGAPAGTTRLLVDAFDNIDWPQDLARAAFWCGAERDAFVELSRVARALGLPRDRITGYAHWRRGMSEPEIAAAGSSAIRE